MTDDERPLASGGILAIEPDFHCAAALQRILRSFVLTEPDMVSCVDEALEHLSAKIPDLILTSTFLPPPDEAKLTAHLRASEGASHVQVITLPPFVEGHTVRTERLPGTGPSAILPFERKRAPVKASCDGRTLARQIEEYLEQARAMRVSAAERRRLGLPSPLVPFVQSAGEGALVLGTPAEARDLGSHHRSSHDRRRASRLKPDASGGGWLVKLPRGTAAKIVDISSLGVLLDTAAPLKAEDVVHIRLIGAARDVSVPARLVRRESAGINTAGTTFRVAAAFSREVDLGALHVQATPGSMIHRPMVLADLLGRVLAEADWDTSGTSLQEKLQEEIRRLIGAEEVTIGAEPSCTPPGFHAVCFPVPVSGEPRLLLQAVFRHPCPMYGIEARLLRAAATLTALVLEFGARSDSLGWNTT